jgi:hypothetical protein
MAGRRIQPWDTDVTDQSGVVIKGAHEIQKYHRTSGNLLSSANVAMHGEAIWGLRQYHSAPMP